MPKLPSAISGQDAVNAFQKDGWVIARYRAHIIMEKNGMRGVLSVPNHKILSRGTLRTLIRYANLTVEDFINLL